MSLISTTDAGILQPGKYSNRSVTLKNVGKMRLSRLQKRDYTLGVLGTLNCFERGFFEREN